MHVKIKIAQPRTNLSSNLVENELKFAKVILFYFIKGTALQGFVCSSDLFQSG